jgi:hypothetical protein
VLAFLALAAVAKISSDGLESSFNIAITKIAKPPLCALPAA